MTIVEDALRIVSNVGKTIINHQITMFIGGILAFPVMGGLWHGFTHIIHDSDPAAYTRVP